MTATVVAAIGLGANLGDAALTVQRAAQSLGLLPRTRLLRCSRLYRTPAWGMQAQPDFVNAVALIDTGLDARALLDALLATEREFGRDRSVERRWGPRTLDLDLLLYGEAMIDEPGLQVPHPHLAQRAFALVPLLEIAPDAAIPGVGAARNAVSGLDLSNIQPL
ncbi:2-amino-4-hydroxy-6-hydroxymethyldihydropteridine diphosphokinase [Pseudoxanthomonas wuyuanensis]|uniref:2-amino-4-hydroxy-6-hydroxymethyldihydropteridine pyrophosphokinase n=1 Tax=Pseudoxanthomonas wuyuanensis TaxID=1073196 RepID=A0A286D992_9GAMM|nr:2-amino-4-hydroxy-6-hydroxymethyldihydropteridine diphosphokinase [Pseudoxanthomonas wuyuanensis]KAF1722032.1 2-amino-4-hydroxy-6-hydroxymethyldihydropteridine diphosphokinase [Pseudoxanthomonas wuyuanensis]SOD55229.1 2-amino-4-hydroxy-6-hydroxymethyldihydropteridinediphosphokinase [Pseudoxanthomonas wuyuanensis]